MKRNKPLKVAGYLLVATMLSTSMVSGTFAKYVTSDTINDSAKVAEFGVKVTADGHLFSDTYITASTDTPGLKDNDTNINAKEGTTLSVVSKSASKNSEKTTVDHNGVDATTGKLVAPGTKNTDGITFSITGTTETAVQLAIKVDNSDDVYLGTGTYPNMTNGDVYDKVYNESNDIFTTSADYYPIKYHLTQTTTKDSSSSEKQVSVNDATGSGSTSDYDLTLAQVKLYLEKLDDTNQGKISANTDLAATYGDFKLTWEWKFEDSKDKEDTLLGELAAGTNVATAISAVNDAYKTAKSSETGILTEPSSATTVAANSYNLAPNFKLTISVTQID